MMDGRCGYLFGYSLKEAGSTEVPYVLDSAGESWRGVWDEFRNWLGLRPAKGDETVSE